MQYFITAKASDSEFDCFTIFQTSEQRAKERMVNWQADIDNGNWKFWSSKAKRNAVEQALARGATITLHYGIFAEEVA